MFADIIEIENDKIFDMRVYKDLCDFENEIQQLWGNYTLDIPAIEDETERKIVLRSMLISFYAEQTKKQLVIGSFRQRPQQEYKHILEFADNLDIVFGIETIYCVKDKEIIKNIRQGGNTSGKENDC
ncbi:MAG: hypothetical protein ACI4E0_06310 [Blautia sp.]